MRIEIRREICGPCAWAVTLLVSTFGRRSTYVALSGVVLRQPRKNMKAEAEDCRRSGQSRREERSHL